MPVNNVAPDLKVKIQLNHENDYARLIAVLNALAAAQPSGQCRLERAFVQQDYILDGHLHELWNAGLTLSIRHSSEVFPHKAASPICTVALKETIFSDFIDINGDLLRMPPETETTPYYEVKESEEDVSLLSLSDIISGAQVTQKTCNSELINIVLKKYFVPGGIHCAQVTQAITSQPALTQVNNSELLAGGFPFLSYPTNQPPSAFALLPPVSGSMSTVPTVTASTSQLNPVPFTLNPAKMHDILKPPQSGYSLRSHTNDVSVAQVPRPSKRGRKSLLDKLLESSAKLKERRVDTSHPSTSTSSSAINSATTDGKKIDPVEALSNVPPAQLPEALKEYQRKRSSEASARYRKRKQQEMELLRKQIAGLNQDVEMWRQRCLRLIQSVRDVKGGSWRPEFDEMECTVSRRGSSVSVSGSCDEESRASPSV